MNVTELLGKRALITEKDGYRGSKVMETKFLEVSPSGNWVKLMTMYGNKYWKPVTDLAVVEVLHDLRANEPLTKEK